MKEASSGGYDRFLDFGDLVSPSLDIRVFPFHIIEIDGDGMLSVRDRGDSGPGERILKGVRNEDVDDIVRFADGFEDLLISDGRLIRKDEEDMMPRLLIVDPPQQVAEVGTGFHHAPIKLFEALYDPHEVDTPLLLLYLLIAGSIEDGPEWLLIGEQREPEEIVRFVRRIDLAAFCRSEEHR